MFDRNPDQFELEHDQGTLGPRLWGFEPQTPSMRTTGVAVTEVCRPVHAGAGSQQRLTIVAVVAVLLCCTAVLLAVGMDQYGVMEP